MMHLRIATLGAAVLAGTFSIELVATERMSVSTFDPAQYCQTVDREAEKVKPASVEEILALEDAARSHDGFAVAEAVLIGGAIDVAHASLDPASCQETFRKGRALFDSKFEAALDGVKREKRHRFKKKEPIRSVQQEITRLWQEDQAGRFAYLGLKTDDKSGAKFWAQRLSVANARSTDERSKRYMEGILGEFDWIDRRRFGSAISDHAWILVQHADGYPGFQADVLERMQPYLENGGVRPKHYAYLYDRVAVNTGQLQLYGTQPTWKCEEDGSMRLKPLEDPATVNQRRKAMGLNTVEEGLETMTRQVCGI